MLSAAALLGVPALGLSAGPAGAATTVVTAHSIAPNGPWKLEPTSNTGSYSFVTGPGTPPVGTGSLAMGIASGQHEWLNNYAYGACQAGPACNAPSSSWTPLTSISALSFSTYREGGTTSPTLNVEVDPTGTNAYATFVFVPNTGSIVNGTWQAWDTLSPSSGTWFSTKQLATGVFSCAPQTCNASFAQILTDYPSAKIKYGLGPNLGTGGTFLGNVDNIKVGVGSAVTTYDFENVASAARQVSAVPGKAKAVVTWKAPLSDGGHPVTGYVVTPYLGSKPLGGRTFGAGTTKHAIAGLKNGKTYRFSVAARTAIGIGAASAPGAATTVGAPGQPVGVTATGAAGTLTVSFRAPASNGATITRYSATCTSSGGATATGSGPSSPVSVSGATAGKSYQCRVTATNSRGNGPHSAPSAPAPA